MIQRETKPTMSLEQIRAHLQDRNLSAVSAATGVHINTLSAVKMGKRRSVQIGTAVTLTDYLLREPPPVNEEHIEGFRRARSGRR